MPNAPKNLDDIQALVEIVAALRGPDGCPWDKEQTHRSLTPYAQEEVAEMIEAIEGGDDRQMKDELGDVLFQVLLHSQLAQERGAFSFADVVRGLNEKMLRRHPHVFGGAAVADAAGVSAQWEEIKRAEKAARGAGVSMGAGAGAAGGDGAGAGAGNRAGLGGTGPADFVGLDVPAGLPALQRAAKIGQRTRKLEFDWQDAEGVLEKVREEFAELDEALEEDSLPHIQHELGDVLFSLAQLARHLGTDPEQCLRDSNRRFERRFAAMMSVAIERGLTWKALTADQKENLWAEAKRRTAAEESR